MFGKNTFLGYSDREDLFVFFLVEVLCNSADFVFDVLPSFGLMKTSIQSLIMLASFPQVMFLKLYFNSDIC